MKDEFNGVKIDEFLSVLGKMKDEFNGVKIDEFLSLKSKMSSVRMTKKSVKQKG